MQTHLNNLLVGHSGEENVFVVRVEFDTVRNLAIRECLLARACRRSRRSAWRKSVARGAKRTSLRIPQLHLTIESGRQELRTARIERDVVHGLRVTHERPQAFAFVVDVP